MKRDQADNQFLTFVLDGETYAVPVGKVREVLEYVKPSKLPRTGPEMKGIINVRGAGIPVIDLRVKLALGEAPIAKDTAIIVMEVRDADGRQRVLGALADAVHEVVELPHEQMEEASKFGSAIDMSFIRSVGKRDGAFVIVLDIDRVLGEEAGGAEATLEDVD